jgi:hypothetical protein
VQTFEDRIQAGGALRMTAPGVVIAIPRIRRDEKHRRRIYRMVCSGPPDAGFTGNL